MARHRGSRRAGILVVDDDELVRLMLRMSLERRGFRVWQAANGRDAIETYRDHCDEISVVLLDVRMPGLDGPETFDELREVDPNVVACFMSGDTGVYEPRELLHRGARFFFPKPLQLERLAVTLFELAGGLPAASLLPCQADETVCREGQ